jgi:hypothetical protein
VASSDAISFISSGFQNIEAAVECSMVDDSVHYEVCFGQAL